MLKVSRPMRTQAVGYAVLSLVIGWSANAQASDALTKELAAVAKEVAAALKAMDQDALVSLAISNARNSRAAAMLEVRSSFSKELGPCVAENRVRSRSFLTIYRSCNKSLTARPCLGIRSGAPAFSWGLRTGPGPKSWPS